jgi:hypothetical protein
VEVLNKLLLLVEQTFKKQWFVFKPSERLLLNYNKEEEALLGKVPVPPPHFAFVLFI